MDAREDLPKVSVETEQDWRRIQQNLYTALLARLDREIETHGQSGDSDALLPHTHQFLETLFDIARPNLRINGRTTEDDPCGDEDDVEPFDEALDRHIWSLSDQRLKWDKEIADRRRLGPDGVQKLIIQSLAQQHHVRDLDVAEETDSYVEPDPKHIDHTLQQTLWNTVSMAPCLYQRVGSQTRRTERAKSVSTEVKALKF